MPRILETDAFALARGIDTMDEAQRPQALDILARYKRQQEDNGEPEWPSQVQAEQENKSRLRGFFEDLKTVDAAAPSLASVLPYSQNPDEDRARVANTAYLASRYGKTADEIGASYELWRDDYATRFLQVPAGLGDLAFHSAAAKEIQREKQKEDTSIEGVKAALRGDDVIPALQAWQAKNLDRMPDSTEFTRGFLQARERAGNQLEFADALLKQIESNVGLAKGDGAQRSAPASRETAAQFEASLATLATMKPKDRKQVYAIIGAKAEAAGYDLKGFWSQMLSELGKGMARMGSTLETQAGVAAAVLQNFPAMLTNTMGEEEFAATDESIAQRQGIGEMYDEVAGIVAGDVDPVRPVISWLNDTVETGLIQAPGAVAPFMLASAALGPYGAGALFTADFAEQNRRDLRAQGMDNVQAMSIGVAAAPLQAAAESLSNALQLGKFPAVQRALASFTKPIGGGAGAVTRYVQNSTLALATEFTEEQVQDNLIVPATQEIFGALSEDVPEVDWSMYRNRAIESTPELLSILVPMALVFGGTMTAAQANLSGALVSSQDMLEAAGYSAAQANEIRIQSTPEAQVSKAREFWGVRAGTPQTIEAAAQTVGERMRLLRNDTAAAQADLERRGILPRMLHAAEDRWKLTFNDGSTADFNSHSEADAARWQWATDQLGKVHLATRSALAQLESGAAVGREFAVEFKPDALTAEQAMSEGRVDMAQLERRVAQGEAVGETAAEPVNEANAFDAATLTDKATSDYLSSLQILGSSVNQFKDGVLRTTIRLYEGANVLTLVEEKLEGDAKQIVESRPGREWLLKSLREYERVSGDKLFRDVADDSQLQNDDLIEAWSSLGQSYLVGKSKKGAAIGKGGARRIFADVLKAGMGGAMNSETQFFNAVWRRAAKLSKLNREGKLGADLTEELERQLGIDSQTRIESEIAAEAEAIANEALYAGGASYSEENPGPNGETFSLGYLGNVQDSGNVQLKAVDLIRATHESEGLDQGSEGMGTFRYRKDNETLYWHFPPGELRKESAIAALERKGFKVKRSIVMVFGSEDSYLAHGLAREVATTFSLSRATPADVSQQTVMPDGARLVGPTTFSIRAYHGTPHKVDKFRTSKIGTGEGAQAYGWGLYFAQGKTVAEEYRKNLTNPTEAPLLDGQKLDNKNPVWNQLSSVELAGIQQLAKFDGDKEKAIESVYAQADEYGIDRSNSSVAGRVESINKYSNRVRNGYTQGNLYTVELIPDEADFLDWDKPLSEQSEKVNDLLAAVAESPRDIERAIAFNSQKIGAQGRQAGMAEAAIAKLQSRLGIFNAMTGAELYNRLASEQGGPATASQLMAQAGIPGIRYLDSGSRGAGDGTRNFVIFDENLVRILEENGKPVSGETFSLRVTPAQDAEYMAAVEAGDMEKVQRMVDEAAKAAGAIKVYARTSGVFEARRGSFVSEQLAPESYGNTVTTLFLINGKIGADSDVMNAVKRVLPSNRFKTGQMASEFLSPNLFESVVTKSEANLIMNDLRFAGRFDAVRLMDVDVPESFVIISPSIIKSADPITRDESGNVIPLSQRFNPADDRITFSLRKFDFSSKLAPAAEILRNMRQGGKAFDFASAYRAASAGQSTSMLPLAALYDEAKKQVPALTEADFGKQIQALYDSGNLLLEPGERADSMRETLGRFGVRDSLGIPAMFARPMKAGETFSMAGVRANVPQFMQDSLITAKAMALEGKDAELIRSVTGWFPGKYDGKMRWEIPDEDARYLPAVKGAKFGVLWNRRLDEVLDHPKLFAAYPYLRNVRVQTVSGLGVNGSIQGDVISLNAENWDVERFSTLLHEVQHWIQKREGFAVGSNPQAENERFGFLRSRLNYLESTDEYKAGLRLIDRAWNAFDEASFSGDQGEAATAAYNAAEGAVEQIYRDNSSLREARKVTRQLQKLTYGQLQFSAKNAYSRSAGEIEARDVQARQSFTPEQRKAIAPYSSENIDRDAAIIMGRFGIETFSLRSGDFASRMAAAFSPFQRNPELRMAIAQVAKHRAQRLGAEWIEKAGVLRTVASIAKEQGIREALGYDQRINAYLESLTPSARQELEFEPAALDDDPLVSAMLDYGKLMSQSTAKREGKVDAKAGDYDGAPWLPPAWYSSGGSVRWAEVTKDGETTTYTGEIPNDVMDDIKSGSATLKRKSRSIPAKGGIMPDQMAQAMFDAGLLPDAFTGTLWAALESRIASTKKNKTAHREAVQAYNAAKRTARAEAKAEAEAWAKQTRKAAGSPKAQRDMLKAALRTLDGILSAAPPEVRARVGGYVKLAGLATDEAMLQEIERRIEKLNVELEKWLKKEGVAEIQKLLKRGRPEAEAGKRGKGKDADMHALFAAAERAIPMTAEAVAGELARLDTLIGGDTLTPEQEALAITERGIIELVGDLKSADSGRVFSGLDTLREIYEGGWIKWKLAQIEKREERAGMRADFIADTGKSGIKPERDAADKAAVTLLGKIKGGFLSLSSFQEVLSYAFGSKSNRVKALVDAEREASGQYEDVTQALADEVESLFADLAGGSVLAGERLRFDMAQRTIKTGKGELSQLEAIQALLMWRQEDGRRHMEGAMDENGKPIGPWNYDQAWIDEITAALTPEARSVMSWLSRKYASEHPALNALYRERYGVNMPAHDNYAPITVQPVQTKSGEVNDPVSGAAISSGSILVPGSLRARSRSAIAEPDFRDSLQTFMAHTRQLEYWKAYYDLAFEASAILGNREVLNAVKAKGGEPAATALRKWIDAIAQGGFRDASATLGLHKLLSRMTGRAASVGLLGRFSTLLVQSTQLGAASVKMPVGAYLIRLSKLLTGNLSFRDAINSPFIQRRYKSAPPIVRQALEGLGVASRPNQVTRATRHLGQLLSGADAMFTAGTYAMLLDYHRGTGRALGLSGAELETHAHTEAERDTEAVAQPTRMATRSLAELTSTNPLAKVSWAYASEARQKIALMAWATMNAKAEPAQFAKTAFLVFGVGGLMTQVLKNLWREAKGDDDESKWSPERLALSALAGPLHGVPLASELMGDQGMLSGVAWAWPALKDIASGEGDMRDVDTLLSTMGLFNDTAAGIASLSHAGLDAAKVLENLASEK